MNSIAQIVSWCNSLDEPRCYPDANSGGADRDRTGDPLVANQVLSQLSYSPFYVSRFAFRVSRFRLARHVKHET
jgi:hypothetical protein